MSRLFHNRYRVETARLQTWNYYWDAAYFVTICIHKRVRYFGIIENHQMVLSEIGKIAHQCWLDIPKHYPFVKLGSHTVMPDHVHGIIVIDRKDDNKSDVVDGGDNNQFINGGGDDLRVETQDLASLQHPPTPPPFKIHPRIPPPSMNSQNKFGPQSKNLASIVRGFKTGVTIQARKLDPEFKWQPRYHDHIIRDEQSFHKITAYIGQNVSEWDDKNDTMGKW